MSLSTVIVAANAQLLRRSAIQGHCSHRAARTEIGGLLTDAVDCANVYSHRVAAPGAWRRTVEYLSGWTREFVVLRLEHYLLGNIPPTPMRWPWPSISRRASGARSAACCATLGPASRRHRRRRDRS